MTGTYVVCIVVVVCSIVRIIYSRYDQVFFVLLPLAIIFLIIIIIYRYYGPTSCGEILSNNP